LYVLSGDTQSAEPRGEEPAMNLLLLLPLGLLGLLGLLASGAAAPAVSYPQHYITLQFNSI